MEVSELDDAAVSRTEAMRPCSSPELHEMMKAAQQLLATAVPWLLASTEAHRDVASLATAAALGRLSRRGRQLESARLERLVRGGG